MKSMWRDNPPLTTNPFTFLVYVSKPYGWSAFGAYFFTILGALATTATAYVFKTIVDAAAGAVGGADLTLLWLAAGAYIAISLMEVVSWRMTGFLGMFWVTGTRATVRYALTHYVSEHSQNYFSNRFAGSISSKISQSADGIKQIAEQLTWDFTPFLVTMAFSFFLAFTTSPLIAFIFLAWVCVITPLNVLLVRWSIPLTVANQKAETALAGTTVDMLTNITAVHEYARRTFELERLKGYITTRRQAGMRIWRFNEWVRLGNGLLQTIFIGGMILTATYLTAVGTLTPGDIILILTIIMLVQDRLTFIGNSLNRFGETWGQVVESLSDLLTTYDIKDTDGATDPGTLQGDIAITDLAFSYGSRSVLSTLSLSIPAGQKVGVVGRSGAGKSTLVKLLLRHQVPSSGTICIGDHNIAELRREALRRNIAIVPQEPILFHRSIRENIAYGTPDASEEAVILAAKQAQAHDFISALEEGYDAMVGERGVKLSGGQRQRIVIARAFVKNAPILILDEATSSLDSESEGAVQKALLNIMEGRTVIAIAHRLSTLRAMDRIIVMDEGRIVEDGTHEELLRKGGLYADLWNHQAGGFLSE